LRPLNQLDYDASGSEVIFVPNFRAFTPTGVPVLNNPALLGIPTGPLSGRIHQQDLLRVESAPASGCTATPTPTGSPAWRRWRRSITPPP
jgi:hypothetical protein